MQISFYKPTYRVTSGDQERRDTAPDTYHNISNVMIQGDGSVFFSHIKNGKEEFLICNLPYKLVGTKEEIENVYRRP